MDSAREEGLLEREDLIIRTYIWNGYKIEETAEYIVLHYATVSRVIKRLEKQKSGISRLDPKI